MKIWRHHECAGLVDGEIRDHIAQPEFDRIRVGRLVRRDIPDEHRRPRHFKVRARPHVLRLNRVVAFVCDTIGVGIDLWFLQRIDGLDLNRRQFEGFAVGTPVENLAPKRQRKANQRALVEQRDAFNRPSVRARNRQALDPLLQGILGQGQIVDKGAGFAGVNDGGHEGPL